MQCKLPSDIRINKVLVKKIEAQKRSYCISMFNKSLLILRTKVPYLSSSFPKHCSIF